MRWVPIVCALMAGGLLSLAGCTRPPGASGTDSATCADPHDLEPQQWQAASLTEATAPAELASAVAPTPGAPAELVAFDAAAQPLSHPATELALLSTGPSDALIRKRIAAFAAEARAAVAILEGRGNTDGFDRHCGRMKNLLDDARLADEDDQFVAALRQADLVLQQLRLARLLLGQRDELAQARTPGTLKLLRDTELECSRIARELQGEIAQLRKAVESK